MTSACNAHYSTTWNYSNNNTAKKSRPLTDEEVSVASRSITTGLLFWPAAIGGFVCGGPLGSVAAIGAIAALGTGVGVLVYKLSGNSNNLSEKSSN